MCILDRLLVTAIMFYMHKAKIWMGIVTSLQYHLSTDDLLWRNFFLVQNVEIAQVTLTTPTKGALTHHKTKTSHGRPVYKTWSL